MNNHSLTKRLVKNIGSMFFARLLEKAIGLIGLVYLARVLGAHGLGQISAAEAIVSYLFLASTLGLHTYGTREIAKSSNAHASPLDIVTLRFLFSIFWFSVLLLIILNIGIRGQYLLTLLFGLRLFSDALNIEWIFRGQEKMEIPAAGKILRVVLYVFSLYFLVESQDNILLVPLLLFSSLLVEDVFYFCVIKLKSRVTETSLNFSSWTTTVYNAFPFGFSEFLFHLYFSFDIILLAYFTTDEIVGSYSAAYRIVGTVLLLTSSMLAKTVFPTISNLYEKDRDQLQVVLEKTQKILNTIAVPVGIGGIVLARPLILFVFGTEYELSIITLKILSISTILIMGNSLIAKSLQAFDHEWRYVEGIGLGAGVNIGLNLILIPNYQHVGAAMATVAADCCMLAYMFWWYRSLVKAKFWSLWAKPLIAGGAMGGLVYGLHQSGLHVLSVILLGAVFYFAFLIPLGGLTLKEIQSILGNNQFSDHT